jgi:hypothetical protein
MTGFDSIPKPDLKRTLASSGVQAMMQELGVDSAEYIKAIAAPEPKRGKQLELTQAEVKEYADCAADTDDDDQATSQ